MASVKPGGEKYITAVGGFLRELFYKNGKQFSQNTF